MKGHEQDELQRQRTHALNRLARVAERQPERVATQAELEAAHRPLRRLFAGGEGAVALLRSIPGFAGLWTQSVPDSYVRVTDDRSGARWAIVSCPCGGQPALQSGNLADCACGRWFLHAGRSIRVWRAPDESAAQAA